MALVATHTPIPTQLPTRTRAPRLWVPSANTSPAREWEVKLKGKGMLGTTHWSARKVVLEGDTLAISKKGATVATIHLGHASVDVAAKGPKKDAYALTLLDLKTKKSYSLSAPAPEDHEQLSRALARRISELRFAAVPLLEVSDAVERLTGDYLDRRSECNFDDPLLDEDDEILAAAHAAVAKVAPPVKRESPSKKVPKASKSNSAPHAAALESVFKTANAAPTKGRAPSGGVLEVLRTPPLVRCMRAMSGAQEDKPQAKLDVPCDAFRLDLTSADRLCVCGWPKSAHAAGSEGKLQGRIAKMKAAYEAGLGAAIESADLEEKLQRARDPQEIRELLDAKRQAAARAEAKAKANGTPMPMLTNVSGEQGKVIVRIESQRIGGRRLPVRYALAGPGEQVPENVALWKTGNSGVATADLDAMDFAAGARVLVAAVAVDGARSSRITTAFFTLGDPGYLFWGGHEHELEGTTADGPERVCAVTGATFTGGGWSSTGADYAICGAAARDAAVPSVGLDVGGRRLWLSEPVAFKGNDTQILPKSEALVALLATAFNKHPGVNARVEGHTNSACGLECDGTAVCDNNTCAKCFGGCGGAVGFSAGRARAVIAMMCAKGVEDDRLSGVGMSGSRRLVEDTESADNHKNRRVELHFA
jgi:outer membrane protein OmpA-like peptidoglycan-associated protein